MKKAAVNIMVITTYAMFLVWGSLSPGGTSGLWFPHFDKVLHTSAYAVFALICAPFWWRSKNALGSTFIILTFLCLFSGAIELAQMLVPRREASWLDMVANALGLIVGWQVSNVIKKARILRAFVTE
jgi:VanZ family protein